ncbi:MAG: qcr9 subunit 9 of the ubiquinol cytochrome-c reductase complex [Alyxoria varia]|nr:MAG: qcr9 subunit 9 of the ubiquinol cytochrome-c reductase complex [Alyxoria varia]
MASPVTQFLYKQVLYITYSPSLCRLANATFSSLFRRNQIFLGVVFLSAFGLEIVYDTSANRIWDYVNRGRQWKDIKHRYMQTPEDDDEE